MRSDREEAPPRPDDEAGRALWDAQQQAALLRRQVADLGTSYEALADRLWRTENTARQQLRDVETRHRAELDQLRGLLREALSMWGRYADHPDQTETRARLAEIRRMIGDLP